MCVLDLKKVLLRIRDLNWFMVTFHSYIEELEAPLAGTKLMSPHHRSPAETGKDPPSMDRKGPLSVRPTFICFKGSFGKTASERRGGAYVGFPERVSTSLA